MSDHTNHMDKWSYQDNVLTLHGFLCRLSHCGRICRTRCSGTFGQMDPFLQIGVIHLGLEMCGLWKRKNLLFLMLSWYMCCTTIFCWESHLTLVTRINKHIWEMMSLHMVSSTVACLVRKLVAQHTVVLLVCGVFLNKLEKLTWVLECLPWGGNWDWSVTVNIQRVNWFSLG